MWESLPWFVQLAIEIGSVIFLGIVAMEAVLRVFKLLLLAKLNRHAEEFTNEDLRSATDAIARL